MKRATLLLALTGFTLLIRTAWRDNSERKVSFREFDVSPAFAQAGYTGVNVARSVADELYMLRDSAGSLSPMRPIRMTGERGLPPLEVEIQGASVSLTAIYQTLVALGPDSSTNVMGELVSSDSAGELVVRVGPRSTRIRFPTSDHQVPRSVFRQAGEFVLLHTEPYILASYYMNADPTRARDLLALLARSREPRHRAQGLLGQAYLASKLGDAGVDLERRFRLSLSADPSYPGPYVNLAAIYNHRDRNREALAILDSVPSGERGWTALAANNRSSIMNSLGRHEEAVAQARQASALEDGLGPRMNAARALIALGEPEAALLELDNAELFVPGVSGVAILRYLSLWAAGRTSEATAHIDSMATDTSLRFLREVLRAVTRSQDSALALARDASGSPQKARTVADVFSLIGTILPVREGHDHSKLLEASEALDARNPRIHWRLARAACRRGDSTAATAHFERVLTLDAELHGPLAPHKLATKC